MSFAYVCVCLLYKSVSRRIARVPLLGDDHVLRVLNLSSKALTFSDSSSRCSFRVWRTAVSRSSWSWSTSICAEFMRPTTSCISASADASAASSSATRALSVSTCASSSLSVSPTGIVVDRRGLGRGLRRGDLAAKRGDSGELPGTSGGDRLLEPLHGELGLLIRAAAGAGSELERFDPLEGVGAGTLEILVGLRERGRRHGHGEAIVAAGRRAGGARDRSRDEDVLLPEEGAQAGDLLLGPVEVHLQAAEPLFHLPLLLDGFLGSSADHADLVAQVRDLLLVPGLLGRGRQEAVPLQLQDPDLLLVLAVLELLAVEQALQGAVQRVALHS